MSTVSGLLITHALTLVTGTFEFTNRGLYLFNWKPGNHGLNCYFHVLNIGFGLQLTNHYIGLAVFCYQVQLR
jgi:hypothetical protein